MKNSLIKGMIAGALLGGSATAMFGVMNWQTAKRMNQQVKKTGRWLSSKADDVIAKL